MAIAKSECAVDSYTATFKNASIQISANFSSIQVASYVAIAIYRNYIWL